MFIVSFDLKGGLTFLFILIIKFKNKSSKLSSVLLDFHSIRFILSSNNQKVTLAVYDCANINA